MNEKGKDGKERRGAVVITEGNNRKFSVLKVPR
jgi:hypothetical protein